MVAREAMAYGRPVVATAVGGLVDAVEDGVTGFVVPPGDISALRGGIVRLLRDQDLRRSLGENGRRRAVRLFSAATACRGTLELYDHVVQEGDAGARR